MRLPKVMVRCSNEQPEKTKDGEIVRMVRCHRRNRVLAPKGVSTKIEAWKCESCSTGNKPYEPRSSARKGQQKQGKKK